MCISIIQQHQQYKSIINATIIRIYTNYTLSDYYTLCNIGTSLLSRKKARNYSGKVCANRKCSGLILLAGKSIYQGARVRESVYYFSSSAKYDKPYVFKIKTCRASEINVPSLVGPQQLHLYSCKTTIALIILIIYLILFF